MTRKYKDGCKVWVKGRVVPSTGVGDDEVVVRIRTSFGESTIGVVPSEDVIRDTSPWQPIESAPKDGTWIFVWSALRRPDEDSYPVAVARWAHGYMDSGAWGQAWRVDGSVDLGWYPDPTHWMPIPPLEVK